MANKMAGVLSSFYPEEGKAAPVLLGYEVTDLHEFFVIFVALSAAAVRCCSCWRGPSRSGATGGPDMGRPLRASRLTGPEA